MNETIYHRENTGRLGKTLKLNLKAVRELLGRHVEHFDNLTPADKILLQRRFRRYCQLGRPDFGIGHVETKFAQEHPPSVDHLPNKRALEFALKVKGGAK